MDSGESLLSYFTQSREQGLSEDDLVDDAYDMICKIYHPVEINGIIEACCIFADNLAKVSFHDISAHIRFNNTSSISTEMRERLGWTLDEEVIRNGGKTKMIKQLNELVNRVFRVKIKMLKPDLKYLEWSLIQTRNYANFNNGYIKRTRRTIVNRIVYTMFMRYHQLPYSFQVV